VVAFNVLAQGGLPEIVASPSPTVAPSTPVPTPTPTPEWLGEQLERYADRCEADPATAQAQIVGMSEEQARDHLRQLIDQCQGGDGGDD
jgi:hypothetical protein